MVRWKKPDIADRRQFTINWDEAAATQAGEAIATEPPAAVAAGSNVPTSAPSPPPDCRGGDLVQILPWDFKTTFPDPLPDAAESGLLCEENLDPQNIQSLHEELGRQLLTVLLDMDEISEARRRGWDPKTKATPSSRGGKQRLKKYLAEEPGRLERAWQTVIGMYESAFGEEATAAFSKAIRARHAGIAVVQAGQEGTVTDPQFEIGFTAKAAQNKKRGVMARLPVPKPLPHAVTAGHFGQDERGPVHPSADEVWRSPRITRRC